MISSGTQFDSTSCALHIFGNIIAEATGCTTRRCSDSLQQPLRGWIGLALWLTGSLPIQRQDVAFQDWPDVLQQAVVTDGQTIAPLNDSIDVMWPILWQGLLNWISDESSTRKIDVWKLSELHSAAVGRTEVAPSRDSTSNHSSARVGRVRTQSLTQGE